MVDNNELLEKIVGDYNSAKIAKDMVAHIESHMTEEELDRFYVSMSSNQPTLYAGYLMHMINSCLCLEIPIRGVRYRRERELDKKLEEIEKESNK